MDLVRAVRSAELSRLVELRGEGRSMDACNRFGESVMHMACRRGAAPMVKFLIADCGLSVRISDDFGRTPLHDACWTANPSFDVVTMLLNSDRHLVSVADSRACLPLSYVHEDHWCAWCKFLLDHKDTWWHRNEVKEWGGYLDATRRSLIDDTEKG